MPRFNFCLLLFAILLYTLTSGVTLRDRLLVSTLHKIERNAYFEPSPKDLFEGAMKGMMQVLEKYGDEYSSYIQSNKQTYYLDVTNNRYEGFGFSTKLYGEGDENKLIIAYPLPESPAFRAGLRSGDQVLQIDGTPVAESIDIETVRLSKPQGEQEFRLTVLPFGQTEPKDYFLRPEKLRFDSVEGDYCDADGRRVFCLETEPKIGYIRITSFSDSTAKEFDHALDRMMQGGAESFILDLRDNGGGDVWNCVQIARMLLVADSTQKVVVSVHPRNGQKRSFTLTEGTQRCALPMVVLIDGDTASSSELLAAPLQDYRRATIVGTRSFGKGIIQGIFMLPFQSGILQLTDSEYRRPNGAAIHRKRNATDADDWGIIPDKTVELTEAEQSAVLQYRSLRSNVVSAERSAILEQFRRQITEDQKKPEFPSESEPQPEGYESKPKQFEFTGTAPYFDGQLDEAIKVLLAH